MATRAEAPLPTALVDGSITPLDILIPEAEVTDAVARLDEQLAEDFQGHDVLAIAVLQGAIPFMGDLMNGRFGTIVQPQVTSVCMSTRRAGIGGPGALQILLPLNEEVCDRHVVIVEDLIDTGTTLCDFAGSLVCRGARSVSVISAIDKPGAHQKPMQPGVVARAAFRVDPRLWVVGYGMDIDGKHRGGRTIRAPRSHIERVPEGQRYTRLV